MLMEFLEFTFQDFWHFAGVLVLLWVICETIENVFDSLSHSHPIFIDDDKNSNDEEEV